MPDTSKRFRDRALDCRNLAKSARSEVDASILEDMAAELEDEANKSDAEKAHADGATDAEFCVVAVPPSRSS